MSVRNEHFLGRYRGITYRLTHEQVYMSGTLAAATWSAAGSYVHHDNSAFEFTTSSQELDEVMCHLREAIDVFMEVHNISTVSCPSEDSEPPQLIIMRGIPGAGKSTWVKKRILSEYPFAWVCSMDDFFVDDVSGVYKWESYLVGQAVAWCREKVLDGLINREPVIVIDNTHTRIWEFAYDIRLAKEFGYNVSVVEIIGEPSFCHNRNVHGVPENSVKVMAKRWQDMPENLEEVAQVIRVHAKV